MHPNIERPPPHLKEFRQDVGALLWVQAHLELLGRKRNSQHWLVAGRIRPVTRLPCRPGNDTPQAREAQQRKTLSQGPGVNLGKFSGGKRLRCCVRRENFGPQTSCLSLVPLTTGFFPQLVRHPVVQRSVTPGSE